MPTNCHRIKNVSVGGVPYQRVPDRQYVEEVTQGTLALRAPGIYWIHFDSVSAEFVNLNPTPSSNGVAITARIIFIPNDLSSPTDEPIVPKFSQRAIVDYAAAQAYALDEDNTDLANQFMADFERRLAELKKVRRGRATEADYLVQEEIQAQGGVA